MKINRENSRTVNDKIDQMGKSYLADNKEMQQVEQEIMLKRLANFSEVNLVFQKINKFFSLLF